MSFLFPNVTVEGDLNLRDTTTNAYYLNVVSDSDGSVLSADRTLSVDVDNADRRLELKGDLSIGGNLATSGTFSSTGNIALSAQGGISILTLPPGPGIVATQAYVDGISQGLDVKESVRLATTPNTNWTTLVNMAWDGVSTLTISGLVAGVSRGLIDGVEPVNGNRILIKDAGVAASGAAATNVYNGLWSVTGGTATTLTLQRTTDADQDAEVTAGLFTFVEEGSTNADAGFVVSTNDPIIVGTTPFVFTQFSGAGQVLAGDGLTKTANTLSVDLSAASGLEFNAGKLQTNLKANGGVVIESGELAVDLSATNITGTLAIVDGGTGATTLEGANIVTQAVAAIAADFIPVSAAASRAIKTTGVSINGANNVAGINNITVGGTATLGSPASIISNPAQTVAANTLTIPDVNAAADTFVFEDAVQVLANKTLTLPQINDTSADHQYVFAVNELTADRTVTLPLLTGNDTFVFENHEQSLFNKSLDGNTTAILDAVGSSTNKYFLAVPTLAGPRTITLPNLTTNDTFVFENHSQTLSNKTLVNPRINNILYDHDGNEMIRFTATASAVNDFTFVNAATGTNPCIGASGDDTNISLEFKGKGTGTYDFRGNGVTAAKIRLQEDSDNGTDYLGLAAPASITTPYTLTFPSALGSAGQVLQDTGSGVLGWVTVATANRRSFSIISTQLNVTSNTAAVVGHFPWDDSQYGSATSITVIVYANVTGLNGVNAELYAVTGGIPSLVATASKAAGTGNGIASASGTAPSADSRLEFRVARTGAGSDMVSIYGIAVEFS